jgi:site-specific DNA-methyltransferase (adenine-specific)
LVFSKGKFGRQGKGRQPTISKEEFLEYTKSVWEFQPESAEKVGHPAPFPVELPHRCIQLYTFQGDVVLDPFCGVGTACVAAIKAGRHFIGIDVNEEYVEKAIQRIELLGQRNRLKQLLSNQFQLSEPRHRKQIGHPKHQAN